MVINTLYTSPDGPMKLLYGLAFLYWSPEGEGAEGGELLHSRH